MGTKIKTKTQQHNPTDGHKPTDRRGSAEYLLQHLPDIRVCKWEYGELHEGILWKQGGTGENEGGRVLVHPW